MLVHTHKHTHTHTQRHAPGHSSWESKWPASLLRSRTGPCPKPWRNIEEALRPPRPHFRRLLHDCPVEPRYLWCRSCGVAAACIFFLAFRGFVGLCRVYVISSFFRGRCRGPPAILKGGVLEQRHTRVGDSDSNGGSLTPIRPIRELERGRREPYTQHPMISAQLARGQSLGEGTRSLPPKKSTLISDIRTRTK